MVRDSFRTQCVRGTYWDCLYFILTSIAVEACSKVSCTASSTDQRMFLRPSAGEVAESAVFCGQQKQERPVLASLPLGAIFQGVHNFSFALEFKYFIIVANLMHSKMNFPPLLSTLKSHGAVVCHTSNVIVLAGDTSEQPPKSFLPLKFSLLFLCSLFFSFLKLAFVSLGSFFPLVWGEIASRFPLHLVLLSEVHSYKWAAIMSLPNFSFHIISLHTLLSCIHLLPRTLQI